MRITIDSDELRGLLDELSKLEREVGAPLLRKALRAGARPVLAAAKALVPKDTGLLESTIKIKSARSRAPGGVAVSVSTAATDFQGQAFYGAFVEYGYRKGSRKLGDRRKVVPPQPFMRPAADTAGAEAIAIVTAEIRSALARVGK